MLKNSGLSENLLESCRQSKRSEYLTGGADKMRPIFKARKHLAVAGLFPRLLL